MHVSPCNSNSRLTTSHIASALPEGIQPRLFVIVGPCGVADGSLFRTLLTPLLFVICDDAPPGYPSVSSDDVQGSAAITDSLVAAGHTRIEVLTDDGKIKPNYSTRVIGYRESLERHGISFDPSLVHAIPIDFSRYFPSSEEQLKKRILPVLQPQSILIHDPPTAVFVLSDFLAFTLMRVLWKAGIIVPRQLSVASFGGWPVTQYTPVSIQTWVQPLNDIIATTLKAMSCLLSNELFPRTLLRKFVKDVWDPIQRKWVERSYKLPAIDGMPFVLIPKGWCRKQLLGSARRFFQIGSMGYIQQKQSRYDGVGKLLKPTKKMLKKQYSGSVRNTNVSATSTALGDNANLVEEFWKYVDEYYKAHIVKAA